MESEIKQDKIIEEEFNKYINEHYSESMILEYENMILHVMKMRQEECPSERNDAEWLEFTDFVCKRRAKYGK